MRARILLVSLLSLGLAWAPPALADVADDTSSGEEGGDDGDDTASDEDDDKGCSQAALNPVTGLSLVVGVGLVLGLRRRR